MIPWIAADLEPLFHRVLETGEPMIDQEVSGPDWVNGGALRHWLVNYWPLEHAGVQGIQASAVAITSIKETEQKLVEQAKIFEQVNDAIIQTDMEGRIRGWNRGAEHLFGYTFDEIAGQHVELLYLRRIETRLAVSCWRPWLPTVIIGWS